ncbi:unnamed protein product [Gongylonema pulchrum]|uniref:Uncharacterized protein n=1 Tax=Gongylonema pulchrum TaxID=637853 RepID=A0A183F175_9BILA|nr:unnamed protein product [Gongylonema pulchrum]
MRGNELWLGFSKGIAILSRLQRFPYPPYTNKIIELGSFFLPTIVAYSFMINVVYITRSIVVEKETQLKVLNVFFKNNYLPAEMYLLASPYPVNMVKKFNFFYFSSWVK